MLPKTTNCKEIEGKVVEGYHIGRSLGFPTANLQLSDNQQIKDGVYIVATQIQSQLKYGLMSVGKRPTFGNNERTIEVHIIDFQEDIYNQTLKVKILHFLRNNKKFSSKEDLIAQLQKDKQSLQKFINRV
ncbi:MAG: riboflavin kinase [Bacteroidales bacterium]|jgi:riboflavin kinase/FMN adenylyltransferase|nr:riboflavin kinase [Bacteroidales bacterium]